MDLWILDRSYNSLAVIDDYVSSIWTVRYSSEGDFEIVMLAKNAIFEFIKEDYYLYTENSDRLMIIEDLTIDTDPEDGDRLTVTGRSLESILHRRLIQNETTLSGKFQDCVERIINENFIRASTSARRIPNFTFRRSEDPLITKLEYDGVFEPGEDCYDVISSMCEENKVGFRILPDYENAGFIFELYAGRDLTWDQNVYPPVVFSNSYENLLAASYYETQRETKTAIQLADSSDPVRYGYATTSKTGSGLDRRELFYRCDLRFEDIAVEIPPITVDPIDPEYYWQLMRYNNAVAKRNQQSKDWNTMLNQIAKALLSTSSKVVAFNGEVDPLTQFIYKRDFDIGDVVQIATDYGQEGKTRITEVTISSDESGETMYPTFETVSDEEIE